MNEEITLDLNKLELKLCNKTTIGEIPIISGVYIFLDKIKSPLYIGKAKNLKSRLSSYFLKNVRGKTKKMIKNAFYVTYIPVATEIESLLLEAKLIRELKPQFNLELRDDKHPLYIRITNDKYKRVLTARKADINKNNEIYYGPFPSSGRVKNVLKIVRKIFPYSTHNLGKRGCLHSQIGLCDPCPNIIERKSGKEKKKLKKKYSENISYIKKFLDGNFNRIKAELQSKMNKYSKAENYEKAKEIKKKIADINYITQPVRDTTGYIKNPNLIEDIREEELRSLKVILSEYFDDINKMNRIECYDVSHLQGTLPASSMVTFIDGKPDKTLYRHFRINQPKSKSDTDSLKETAKRRKKRFNDWGIPDLIIVDGGRGQVSSFVKIFGNEIHIVGIAKSNETLIIPEISDGKIKKYRQKKLKGPALNLVQRLRDEAHRFSRRYHHKLVEKRLFMNKN